ncbi:MAG: hypothetical protein LBT26_01920 [Clostridiales Family XIII bacterium]|jgi:hypothetical protein|nr:hypothetical protein [Clostridiales Family XIII bacterium]
MKQVITDPIMLGGMTDCLAAAVENAVIEWGETVESFFDKFINSTLADSFSKQEPFVTTGCAGEELVAMVMQKVTGKPQTIKSSSSDIAYSEYYWVGYAIALFVAECDVSIKNLIALIPVTEWLRMYLLYHEYGDDLLLEKLKKRVTSRNQANCQTSERNSTER